MEDSNLTPYEKAMKPYNEKHSLGREIKSRDFTEFNKTLQSGIDRLNQLINRAEEAEAAGSEYYLETRAKIDQEKIEELETEKAELLAALEAVVTYWKQRGGVAPDCISQATVAIAKAKTS